MAEFNIHSKCRKCDKELTDEELAVIKQQIEELYYASSTLFGKWHGLCKSCQDATNNFVVS